MEQTLQLVFKTGTGTSYTMTIDNPKPALTPLEIQTAMNAIIAKNIFAVEGGLTEIGEANTIDTQVNPITFA